MVYAPPAATAMAARRRRFLAEVMEGEIVMMIDLGGDEIFVRGLKKVALGQGMRIFLAFY